MKFELPPLPYDKSALEPYITARTLDFHYEKHHRGYLDRTRTSRERVPARSSEIRRSRGTQRRAGQPSRRA